jgi:hypothetical protein
MSSLAHLLGARAIAGKNNAVYCTFQRYSPLTQAPLLLVTASDCAKHTSGEWAVYVMAVILPI